ncbi:uncharacterized protein [Chelonus insularis]|nr:uncharacterized protein LOC118067446 isoform X2 [Chelonus insularis]XP_034940055.1 uncharacterized protein LOC118067446 isoform X2 [Chelonus insularis]
MDIEIKNAGDIVSISEGGILSTTKEPDNKLTTSVLHYLINNEQKKVRRWKRKSPLSKRMHRVKRRHHSLASFPKEGSVLSFSFNSKEMKRHSENDTLQTMINLTQELINFNKISSSLLSQLPAVGIHNNNSNTSELMMSKNTKEGKDKSLDNNTNNPESPVKIEIPITCTKSKNSSSHACNQHSSNLNGSLINIELSSSAKNIPVQNKLLALSTAFNASANIQHQSMSTHASLKSTTKSSTLTKRRVPKFLQGTNNDTTQTSLLIIDGFGVFDHGVEDIPVIPEHVDNIKTRVPPAFDIFGNNKNARWPDDEWKQWNYWNVESEKLEKAPELFHDQHLLWAPRDKSEKLEKLPETLDDTSPWILKDNIPAPMLPKNQHINYFINKQNMDSNIKIVQPPDEKNETRVARKANPKGNFQPTFLSTFYISLVVCGFFFAIAVWWRRYTINKRANFITISDTLHSSTPRDSNKPLINY